MRRPLLFGIVGLMVAACYHGPSLQKYEVATRADGEQADIRLRKGGNFIGELLAVDETGLVIRDAQHLLRIPFTVVRDIRLRGVRQVRLDGRKPSADFVRRAQLVSRFPSGLSPELERALLDAYAQQAITVIAP